MISNFKSVHIVSTDLDDCWHQLLFSIVKNGRKYEITSGSHNGEYRLVFDFVSGVVLNPHTDNLAPILPEQMKIPPPTTNDNIYKYFNNYLLDGELGENEEYKYSCWIVGENKLCKTNQLEWVINHFKKHGYGNEHCFITIGNPDINLNYDKPYKKCPVCNNYYPHEFQICTNEKCSEEKLFKDELKRGTSPCLRSLDFRIINDNGKNYLTTNIYYRSWDLFTGFSENMGGFTLLNQYLANSLEDVLPGPLTFSSKSLHVYSHAIEFLNQRTYSNLNSF